MKDLGYPRTPTTAQYRVTMPDGSVWAVPAQIIVDSRDENYAEDEEDTVGAIQSGALNSYEIYDWAANNMNWSDVEDYAVKVSDRPELTGEDFQEAWMNGEKELCPLFEGDL